MKIWKWFVLLTPAVELMIVNRNSERWGSFLFHRDELPGLWLLILNLPIVLALSIALGIWHLPPRPWSERIVLGALFGCGIAVTNGAIAFAGCSLGLGGRF